MKRRRTPGQAADMPPIDREERLTFYIIALMVLAPTVAAIIYYLGG